MNALLSVSSLYCIYGLRRFIIPVLSNFKCRMRLAMVHSYICCTVVLEHDDTYTLTSRDLTYSIHTSQRGSSPVIQVKVQEPVT